MASEMVEHAYGHLEQNEWTEARRAFETELVAHPGNLDARYNLALLLAKAGHPDSEKELYLENMKLGWHLPTIVNLAAIYSNEGNIPAARALLQKGARHFRHEATPLYLLAGIEEKSSRKKADGLYEEALEADPLNGYAHIRYARFLAGEKKYTDALKHGERGVALLPDSAAALSTLADIQVAAGSYEDALGSYQKSLSIQPDPDTRQKLINLLHKVGDHDRADRMQQALDAWLRHQGS